jgi:hypothetical protein
MDGEGDLQRPDELVAVQLSEVVTFVRQVSSTATEGYFRAQLSEGNAGFQVLQAAVRRHAGKCKFLSDGEVATLPQRSAV